MKIIRARLFSKDLDKLVKRKPNLIDPIELAIKRFNKNPKDTRLKTHALRKRLTGKFAFSVTGNIRIVFESTSKNTVRLLAIGPHPRVYPKIRLN